MHQGALGRHHLHLGAPGARSQEWGARAGKETGANYGMHSLIQTSDIKERRGYQAAHIHSGAAGKGSGANYEVVTRGQSTSFVRTAPFANDSSEWRHSTKRLPQSGAHVFRRAGHSTDAMTRDEFQATLHATHKPVMPQDGSLLDPFREKLQLRGVPGIASLLQSFRALDITGDRMLSFNEFAKGFLSEGLADSADECRKLFRVFDSDGTGNIDFHELVVAACGRLSSRRQAIVLNVFRSLDPAGVGAVRLTDLLSAFDARAHPAVRTGQVPAEVIQQEFSAVFDVGLPGRYVPLNEFELYYTAVSARIDDDRQFEGVAQDTWQLPGALCM